MRLPQGRAGREPEAVPRAVLATYVGVYETGSALSPIDGNATHLFTVMLEGDQLRRP